MYHYACPLFLSRVLPPVPCVSLLNKSITVIHLEHIWHHSLVNPAKWYVNIKTQIWRKMYGQIRCGGEGNMGAHCGWREDASRCKKPRKFAEFHVSGQVNVYMKAPNAAGHLFRSS